MIRAFQWDLGRQVERLDWLLAQLPRYAAWGYTELYLHLEDAVEFPSLPGVARGDAYSQRQLGRLVERAARHGIGVVPIVNLLGHTQYLIKVPGLRDLNELRAPDGSPLERGQICPVHPRTLEVAEALLGDVAAFCTAGKVHVGLDESFHLGRHPLSAAEVAEIGLAAHFGRYVRRLGGLAQTRGLRLGYWADMLALLPAAVDLLPPGSIAYDWYYYPFGRRPRMELHNFAEYDLAAPLRARGVEYWGCPMNGSFRHEPLPVFGERLANIRSWWRRCADVGAGGMLVTSWEPLRMSAEMATLVDASASSLWQAPEVDDLQGMLEHGFRRLYGRAHARERARAALACDIRAFAGYARWEVNEHWDGADLRRGLSRYDAERAFFTRLLARGPSLPRALRASLRFRLYLAERDVFVRSCAARVRALRRRLARGGPGDPELREGLGRLLEDTVAFHRVVSSGRRAARALWALTRAASRTGPNERMVLGDARRLGLLERWIRGCLAHPSRVSTASPVSGAWELQVDIVLQEPALQRVVVERRGLDHAWIDLRGRTTVEFRADAARPRARVRRELRVPVGGPGQALRIAVRGLGSVTLTHLELTDGVRRLRPRGWTAAARRVVGKAAPASGFPELDWSRDTGFVEPVFG